MPHSHRLSAVTSGKDVTLRCHTYLYAARQDGVEQETYHEVDIADASVAIGIPLALSANGLRGCRWQRGCQQQRHSPAKHRTEAHVELLSVPVSSPLPLWFWYKNLKLVFVTPQR